MINTRWRRPEYVFDPNLLVFLIWNINIRGPRPQKILGRNAFFYWKRPHLLGTRLIILSALERSLGGVSPRKIPARSEPL